MVLHSEPQPTYLDNMCWEMQLTDERQVGTTIRVSFNLLLIDSNCMFDSLIVQILQNNQGATETKC